MTSNEATLLHLVPGAPSWPHGLEGVAPSPEDLWAVGRVELLDRRPRVAIVGTRSPTPYGTLQAGHFSAALAAAGVTVVSGLARGIDACAHEAALEAAGATIAVLGSAADRPWPRGRLTKRMQREGLLLSEHPPGTGPRRHHFPLRNRLISGLANAVLVVEAAFRSGSLITARWALEQGREVYALPGRVDQPMARGCHRLLREGARLVESPEELLHEAFGSQVAKGKAPASRLRDADAGPEPELLRRLTGATLSAEELAQGLGRRVSEVLAALVDLELDAHVVRAPGGLWRRARMPDRPPESSASGERSRGEENDLGP